jgi:hypothetical protein
MFVTSRRDRRRGVALAALVAAAVLLVTGAPSPAPAAPGGSTADPEGGTPALRSALASASRGYAEARGRLAASQRRQAALIRQRRVTEVRAAALSKDVDLLAAAAYRNGRLTPLTAALDSGSVPSFLGNSALIDQLSTHNNEKMRALTAARKELDRQQRQLAAEIRLQAVQERAMAKRKSDAERALRAVGGAASSGFSSSSSGSAKAAPRAADGSFAGQGCTVDDPTTAGCLTPRTLHALQQARAAGFTRHTACFREASFGEHPEGRACDFSAAAGGFGGVATGDDKAYGERLAGYFVDNADRLGVLYVIWFRQIWLPGTGWRAYNGGNGDPASDHTNHVHLSVQ